MLYFFSFKKNKILRLGVNEMFKFIIKISAHAQFSYLSSEYQIVYNFTVLKWKTAMRQNTFLTLKFDQTYQHSMSYNT